MQRPNGVRFSGGALLDRESVRADSRFQNGRDLTGAERVRCNGLLGGRIALAHIDALLLYATFRNSSRTTRRNSASNDCLSMCSRSA